MKTILVTGGCGFIGSNFIRWILDAPEFGGRVVNLDALTYAGNPANLAGTRERHAGRYVFVRGDICDPDLLERIFAGENPDTVVNFAAETHVDRSIAGPSVFVRTNVEGTLRLLDAARAAWRDRPGCRFHQVGTDEVFGSLGPEGLFTEESRYDPRSPYAASKAAADHIAMSFHHTYAMDVTLSNCSNNYGPRQFPEKMIPLMICNMLDGAPLPIYGDGLQVRDWLHVDDHCRGIWSILRSGRPGRAYLLGASNERTNVELVRMLCAAVGRVLGRSPGDLERLVVHVADRPGHDRRYALDSARVRLELGWTPLVPFDEGLETTVRWYVENREWVASVRSGAYREWMRENYAGRPPRGGPEGRNP